LPLFFPPPLPVQLSPPPPLLLLLLLLSCGHVVCINHGTKFPLEYAPILPNASPPHSNNRFIRSCRHLLHPSSSDHHCAHHFQFFVFPPSRILCKENWILIIISLQFISYVVYVYLEMLAMHKTHCLSSSAYASMIMACREFLFVMDFLSVPQGILVVLLFQA
jgi:hypothetical protein